MTVPPDRPPLDGALGIPGAQAVALLDPEGPTVLWWAGAAPPDEQQAAAVVTLAAAAAGLVLLADRDDELGDVLLTSADAFHVVRLVDQGVPRVAHLTLRRAGANLAMARREFRSLIETYARTAAPLPSSLPAPPTGSLALGSGSAPASPSAPAPVSPSDSAPVSPSAPAPASPSDSAPAEEEESTGDLPRRRRIDPEDDPASDTPPDWFTLLGQNYVTDEVILEKVLDTLRRL